MKSLTELTELTEAQQAEVKRRQQLAAGALTQAQAIEVVLAQTAHEEAAAKAAKPKKDSGKAKPATPAQ